jgi:hypothetical protein
LLPRGCYAQVEEQLMVQSAAEARLAKECAQTAQERSRAEKAEREAQAARAQLAELERSNEQLTTDLHRQILLQVHQKDASANEAQYVRRHLNAWRRPASGQVQEPR